MTTPTSEPAAQPIAPSPTERAARLPAAPPPSSEPTAATPPDPSSRLPAPPTALATPPGIDELRAAWPAIVAALSQSPPVKPLIAECRPISSEGPLITLGFPEDKAFMKDLLERRRTVLEDGIGRILGRPVNVRCVATNLEHVPAVPLGDAADLISEARRIFADDLVDVGEVT